MIICEKKIKTNPALFLDTRENAFRSSTDPILNSQRRLDATRRVAASFIRRKWISNKVSSQIHISCQLHVIRISLARRPAAAASSYARRPTNLFTHRSLAQTDANHPPTHPSTPTGPLLSPHRRGSTVYIRRSPNTRNLR